MPEGERRERVARDLDFVPQALADGRYLAAPEPAVVGQGIGRIQAGLDAQLNGVSARKVVVAL